MFLTLFDHISMVNEAKRYTCAGVGKSEFHAFASFACMPSSKGYVILKRILFREEVVR